MRPCCALLLLMSFALCFGEDCSGHQRFSRPFISQIGSHTYRSGFSAELLNYLRQGYKNISVDFCPSGSGAMPAMWQSETKKIVCSSHCFSQVQPVAGFAHLYPTFVCGMTGSYSCRKAASTNLQFEWPGDLPFVRGWASWLCNPVAATFETQSPLSEHPVPHLAPISVAQSLKFVAPSLFGLENEPRIAPTRRSVVEEHLRARSAFHRCVLCSDDGSECFVSAVDGPPTIGASCVDDSFCASGLFCSSGPQKQCQLTSRLWEQSEGISAEQELQFTFRQAMLLLSVVFLCFVALEQKRCL